MTSQAFWEARFSGVPDSWRADAERTAAHAESRRARAKFNTGSITTTAAVALRAIAAWAQARTVIEVGTFIGNSTETLRRVATTVYTCDASNDCLPSGNGIETFPKHTSTEMLTALAARCVRADLAFIDGKLDVADVALLRRVMTDDAVYLLDDYYLGPSLGPKPSRKGVTNAGYLLDSLSGTHRFFPPPNLPSVTIAAFVPESRL